MTLPTPRFPPSDNHVPHPSANSSSPPTCMVTRYYVEPFSHSPYPIPSHPSPSPAYYPIASLPPLHPQTTTNLHPIITQSKDIITNSNPKYGLLTTPLVDIELTNKIQDPRWHQVVTDANTILLWTNTWELVPPSPVHNLVACRFFVSNLYPMALLIVS